MKVGGTSTNLNRKVEIIVISIENEVVKVTVEGILRTKKKVCRLYIHVQDFRVVLRRVFVVLRVQKVEKGIDGMAIDGICKKGDRKNEEEGIHVKIGFLVQRTVEVVEANRTDYIRKDVLEGIKVV